MSQIWPFIVAPLIGAAIASLLYKAATASEPLIEVQVAEAALPSAQAGAPVN